MGLSAPFVTGGGLLLCIATAPPVPFFIGLISGHGPAGVLPMFSKRQKGAGLLSARWLVGSLTVLGCSMLRLWGLGAGVRIIGASWAQAPDVSVGEESTAGR